VGLSQITPGRNSSVLQPRGSVDCCAGAITKAKACFSICRRGSSSETPGTGKGLLAQAIVLVSTGAYPGVIAEKDDNDELRKTITALLMEGASAVVIDNVTRKIGQVSLAALLTTRTLRDRLLGKSKTVEVPNRTLWIVAGNNVAMNDEMARRAVRIRLDAGVAEPWDRQGFRHDALLEWAEEYVGN
jgi:hypothetical protein